MEKLDYWKKITKLPAYKDLEWNIPEQKSGTASIIGGNSQNFSTVIRSAEYLGRTYPVKNLRVILPDCLKGKLPLAPDLIFCPSTESGSFADSPLLKESVDTSDISIFIGDFSRNSATAIAVAKAIKDTSQPTLVTRDSIDLILPEMPNIIERDNLLFVASLIQVQKLFRAVYYPKVILLSMPLVPVVEALHKFTLSYSTTILTFHQGQIIVANNGKVFTIPIEKTHYTPISLWSGTLAMKITAMNLYNPGQKAEATLSAI